MRHRGGDARKDHLDLSAHRIGERLVDASIRHRHAGHAGRVLELLHHQMIERADAGGSVIDLARVCLRVRDEFLQRVDRHGTRDDEHVRRAAEHRDRREILDGVVAEIALHRRVCRVGGDVADHQRVAVRLRPRDGLRGDCAAGARDVLDDEGLAQRCAQLVGDQARDEVHATAGRLRRDDLHRPARIGVLREGGRGRRDEGNGDKRTRARRFALRARGGRRFSQVLDGGRTSSADVASHRARGTARGPGVPLSALPQ